MNISTVEVRIPDAEDVTVTEDTLTAELSDGRTISVPLAWYPRLVNATEEEKANWTAHRLGGPGHPLARPGRGRQRGRAACGQALLQRESEVLSSGGSKLSRFRPRGDTRCTAAFRRRRAAGQLMPDKTRGVPGCNRRIREDGIYGLRRCRLLDGKVVRTGGCGGRA